MQALQAGDLDLIPSTIEPTGSVPEHPGYDLGNKKQTSRRIVTVTESLGVSNLKYLSLDNILIT